MDGEERSESEAGVLEAATCPPDECVDASSMNQSEILKALQVVEKDSATGSSVDHMRCFNDAAGTLQESGMLMHWTMLSTSLFDFHEIQLLTTFESLIRKTLFLLNFVFCLRVIFELGPVFQVPLSNDGGDPPEAEAPFDSSNIADDKKRAVVERSIGVASAPDCKCPTFELWCLCRN
ncbi:hypothetical protein ACFE04_013509 [Oxalis oulophora]